MIGNITKQLTVMHQNGNHSDSKAPAIQISCKTETFENEITTMLIPKMTTESSSLIIW